MNLFIIRSNYPDDADFNPTYIDFAVMAENQETARQKVTATWIYKNERLKIDEEKVQGVIPQQSINVAEKLFAIIPAELFEQDYYCVYYVPFDPTHPFMDSSAKTKVVEAITDADNFVVSRRGDRRVSFDPTDPFADRPTIKSKVVETIEDLGGLVVSARGHAAYQALRCIHKDIDDAVAESTSKLGQIQTTEYSCLQVDLLHDFFADCDVKAIQLQLSDTFVQETKKNIVSLLNAPEYSSTKIDPFVKEALATTSITQAIEYQKTVEAAINAVESQAMGEYREVLSELEHVLTQHAEKLFTLRKHTLPQYLAESKPQKISVQLPENLANVSEQVSRNLFNINMAIHRMRALPALADDGPMQSVADVKNIKEKLKEAFSLYALFNNSQQRMASLVLAGSSPAAVVQKRGRRKSY